MRYIKRTLEQFRVEFQKIYGKEPTPNEFQQFLANLVWSFMWRAYVILFGIGFAIGILATMFSL
jgi:hypothetical protein